MRIVVIFFIWSTLLGFVGWLFWVNDLRYGAPTPIPQDHVAVDPGATIDLRDQFDVDLAQGLFIHFFNPRCPCSRFNLPHVRSLVQNYGDRMRFAVVVIDPDSSYTIEEIQDELGIPLSVSFDHSIAEKCGVYSTPQAVILNADSKLHYRGNYNKTRYCTDKKTNYAEQALVALLGEKDHRAPLAATESYGCELPKCSQTRP